VERYLHTKYFGQSVFLFPGKLRSLIPRLTILVQQGGKSGVEETSYRHGGPRPPQCAGELLGKVANRSVQCLLRVVRTVAKLRGSATSTYPQGFSADLSGNRACARCPGIQPLSFGV